VPFSQVSSNTIVTLQPWGRIEGTIILGGQRRANQTISLGSVSFATLDAPRLFLFISTKTDANGRFVSRLFPPGERRVDWDPGFRDGKAGMIPLVRACPSRSNRAKPRTSSSAERVAWWSQGCRGRRDKPIDWTQDVQSLTLKLSTPPEPVFPKRQTSRPKTNSPQRSKEARNTTSRSDLGRGKALQRRSGTMCHYSTETGRSV